MAAAVKGLHDPHQPVAPPAHQEALFPADQLDQLPASGFDRQQQLRKRDGAGRPAGAINKSTAEWRDHILGRYRSPLLFLAETYSRSVHDLAKELGCTPKEAYDRQLVAARELAPYLHGKMPIEVDLGGTMPILQLVDPRFWQPPAQPGSGEDLPDLRDVTPIQQNQGVIDGSAVEVERPELNAGQNADADQVDSANDALTKDQQA